MCTPRVWLALGAFRLYAAIKVKRFADDGSSYHVPGFTWIADQRQQSEESFHVDGQHNPTRSIWSMRCDDFRGIDSAKRLHESTMMHNLMAQMHLLNMFGLI